MRATVLAIISLAIVSALPAAAQQKELSLTVRVSDPTNTPIPGALVLLHADVLDLANKVRVRYELRTSSLGSVQKTVARGWYDVFIGVPGFVPACKQIHVTSDSKLEFKLKLGGLYATDTVEGAHVM